MAGIIKVDEIRDTAGTGSPSFPNGLDITELVDPVGSEGDVLTVGANGSIAAAAASGAGIPIQVDGISDLSDAEEIATAILVSLTPLQLPPSLVAGIQLCITELDGSGHNYVAVFDEGAGMQYALELPGWIATGAGSVLVWSVMFYGL